MKFADWIEEKFAEWRVEVGRPRATVLEFSQHLGVPQPLLSQWMKRDGGKVPKSKKHVDALLAKYRDDPRLYELLGIEPEPDPLEPLPPDLREAYLEIRSALAGIEPDSPEAERIVIEIMGRYGYKHTATERERPFFKRDPFLCFR